MMRCSESAYMLRISRVMLRINTNTSSTSSSVVITVNLLAQKKREAPTHFTSNCERCQTQVWAHASLLGPFIILDPGV